MGSLPMSFTYGKRAFGGAGVSSAVAAGGVMAQLGGTGNGVR
ncbi:hypothetical protein BVG79_01518 [Ketogulonicigenium robustum]|uniref:Uncharacterized protein n=1 Tax=Ketogulonicigenium robustum TaxID=92947 RepID=A0A1W6P094_9RHOB|nr:hypothetical protein BVG79_01518 [Ketogulonicigenium robustum]